jgi:hypothetical protein
MPEETEKPQNQCSVFGPRFEPRTSNAQSRHASNLSATFGCEWFKGRELLLCLFGLEHSKKDQFCFADICSLDTKLSEIFKWWRKLKLAL